MSDTAKRWDSKFKRRPDVCSSIRGGDGLVVEEAHRIRDVIQAESGSRILDLCCGDGSITNALAAEAKMAFGVDGSIELLKLGQKATEEMGLSNVVYLNSEAAGIPFADDSFDVTLCLSAFHYYPDYDYAKKVIRELVRVTKPSGKILIAEVPSRESVWYSLWNVIRNRDESMEPVDFIEFGKMSSLNRIMARVGLLFRRLAGRRVDSDEWLWYSKDFFKNFEGGKFKVIKVFPSQQTGMIRYRFDVLVSNKQAILI